MTLRLLVTFSVLDSNEWEWGIIFGPFRTVVTTLKSIVVVVLYIIMYGMKQTGL